MLPIAFSVLFSYGLIGFILLVLLPAGAFALTAEEIIEKSRMSFFNPGDDDRWLFVPAINMVRRIAAKDKNSSFAGSDFMYEDISGRNVADDSHSLVREEKADGEGCYQVKSVPKPGSADYGYRLSWIHKTTFLPLKEEFYDANGELYKVFTADEIKDVSRQ